MLQQQLDQLEKSRQQAEKQQAEKQHAEKLPEGVISANSKPADKAADKPADKPVDKAADKPVDKAADKPVDKAADKPVDKVAESKPADKPVDKVADKPAETKAVDKPADKAVEGAGAKQDSNGSTDAPPVKRRGTGAAAAAALAAAMSALPAPCLSLPAVTAVTRRTGPSPRTLFAGRHRSATVLPAALRMRGLVRAAAYSRLAPTMPPTGGQSPGWQQAVAQPVERESPGAQAAAAAAVGAAAAARVGLAAKLASDAARAWVAAEGALMSRALAPAFAGDGCGFVACQQLRGVLMAGALAASAPATSVSSAAQASDGRVFTMPRQPLAGVPLRLYVNKSALANGVPFARALRVHYGFNAWSLGLDKVSPNAA